MRISDWSSDVGSSDLRVLAECEAKRQAIWAAWDDHERIDHEWGWCRSMKEMDALGDAPGVVTAFAAVHDDHPDSNPAWRTRSEERRVGKACVSTCRSRGSTYP